MTDSEPNPTPPIDPYPRRRAEPFRPRFTLSLLYLVGFFVLFALLLAIPQLVQGLSELGPGPEQLTDAELARAEEIGRQALSGGRLLAALAAAVIAVGLGSFRGVLPGLRLPENYHYR